MLTNLSCGFSGVYVWGLSPVLNLTASPLSFPRGKSGSSPSDWEQCAAQGDEMLLHTLPGPCASHMHRDATHCRERPCVLLGLWLGGLQGHSLHHP